jgi:hypothetical protein
MRVDWSPIPRVNRIENRVLRNGSKWGFMAPADCDLVWETERTQFTEMTEKNEETQI